MQITHNVAPPKQHQLLLPLTGNVCRLSPVFIGVVAPHSSLECEFICQPSFNSPGTAQFMLGVEGEEVEGEKGGIEDGRAESPASNVLCLVAQVMYLYRQLDYMYVHKSMYAERPMACLADWFEL